MSLDLWLWVSRWFIHSTRKKGFFQSLTHLEFFGIDSNNGPFLSATHPPCHIHTPPPPPPLFQIMRLMVCPHKAVLSLAVHVSKSALFCTIHLWQHLFDYPFRDVYYIFIYCSWWDVIYPRTKHWYNEDTRYNMNNFDPPPKKNVLQKCSRLTSSSNSIPKYLTKNDQVSIQKNSGKNDKLFQQQQQKMQ